MHPCRFISALKRRAVSSSTRASSTTRYQLPTSAGTISATGANQEFVRHEHMEPWRGEGEHFWPGWPERLLYNARSHKRRILCRHFPYRSPSQIERRLKTRAASAVHAGEFWHEAIKNWGEMFSPASIRERRLKGLLGGREFQTHQFQAVDHPSYSDWRSRVIDASQLEFDAHDGQFVINEDLMPPIPRLHPRYYEWKDKIRSKLKWR